MGRLLRCPLAHNPFRTQVVALTAKCRTQRQALGRQLLHHKPKTIAALQPGCISNGKATTATATQLLSPTLLPITAQHPATIPAEQQLSDQSVPGILQQQLQPAAYLSDLHIRCELRADLPYLMLPGAPQTPMLAVSQAARVQALCRNLALVEEQHIQFQPGLNVITGESGTGKSVLLNALGLALGSPAPPNYIRAPAKQATVEATFQLHGPGKV